jgi:hypothetical protein
VKINKQCAREEEMQIHNALSGGRELQSQLYSGVCIPFSRALYKTIQHAIDPTLINGRVCMLCVSCCVQIDTKSEALPFPSSFSFVLCGKLPSDERTAAAQGENISVFVCVNA